MFICEDLHGKPIDNEVRPFYEFHCAGRSNLSVHSNNATQIIVIDVIASAICGSYSKFSNNCPFIDLIIGKNPFQVIVEKLSLEEIAP